MEGEFVEIGPDQNFFIGGNEKLILWVVSQGKVTKDFGPTMAG
jgi:hypothetical protein